MNIITGYRAEPHITAQQDRNANIGIFGSGAHILDVGAQMSATVVSANEIEIADGTMVAEGCTAEIARGTTESLAIENGNQGMLRIDLIVARYSKASGTGIEDMSLVVITGTPASASPAVPTYNTGVIADGDSPVDFPLYRVNLNGISITSVERLVDVLSINGKFDDVDTRIDGVDASISAIETAMGGVKMKAVSRQDVTLPAGGGGISQTVVSFEDYLPSNALLVGVDITMGDFHFPYVRDGRPATWVAKKWERAVRIDNTTSPWPADQYIMYATLFYVEGNA
jgi:hypothetical protein